MKYCYKILKIYYDSTSKLFLDIRIRIPGNYTTLKMEKKETMFEVNFPPKS